MTSPWYAVHCDPRRDRQVQQLLAQHGLEPFAPRIPKTRRRNGDKPLFPGYVFARMDLDTGIWGNLRFMPGIRALVSAGGVACPVDDGIVETIRRRIALWGDPTARLRPGDRVHVIGGHFEHLEGLFSETLTGQERVAVLLDMMGRQVRVEILLDDVERIAPSPASPEGGGLVIVGQARRIGDR